MVQRVDQPSEAFLVGADGWFTTVESTSNATTYFVDAQIPVFQDVQGGTTEARLRAAGTAYESADLTGMYTSLPPGSMGPAAEQLLADIRAAVPADRNPNNPYDLARTMEAYLRSSDNFQYTEDVRDEMRERCADISTAECFALIKRGYCEFYASTMAVLLRASGIPARIAYGFLPGERGVDGVEVVSASLAHWWVEVYFPGEISNWVEFDPTGGGVGRPQPIPSGSIGPPTARPSVLSATFPNEPTERPDGPVGGINNPSTGIGPFIAIAIILAIGVAALAFASYRRTPNRPMHPDQAWGSVGRLAQRFGLGPRPSQTVYEYAGALGDAVPDARIELTTIARAKVEVAYGKRDLGSDRLRLIAAAYHRLRFAILGVVVRRLLRRRRGG
jgi:transglutaminase-like putative cysteine protease